VSDSQIVLWTPQELIDEFDHINASVDPEILAPALRKVGITHTSDWRAAALSLEDEVASTLRKDLRTRVAAANFALRAQ
jgi:hypothetical protein